MKSYDTIYEERQIFKGVFHKKITHSKTVLWNCNGTKSTFKIIQFATILMGKTYWIFL